MGLYDSKTEMYQSFTPPTYTAERNALNPMLWGTLNQQMKGEPTASDWNYRDAMMRSIRQNYGDATKAWGGNFAGRGVFDSGWMGQKRGQLLGQRAGQEADATNQFWQNIMARQMQATGQAANTVAGARQGSGTYQWES